MKKPVRWAWTGALALLLCALVFFNLPPAAPGGEGASAPAPALAESSAPEGHAVGERLPDFTLPQLGGGEFTLSAQRGSIVVINLWATWCTPCVNELPHFDRLHRERAGDVSVLAIHSDLVTDDVGAYLAEYDYRLPFAIDETGEVTRALGGSPMLPQTLVLNRKGEVTYNQVGSVTYEGLEELVRAAEER